MPFVEIQFVSAKRDPSQDEKELPKPYFTEHGTLVIPQNSDPKYHYWKDGQKVRETVAELLNTTSQITADERAFHA